MSSMPSSFTLTLVSNLVRDVASVTIDDQEHRTGRSEALEMIQPFQEDFAVEEAGVRNGEVTPRWQKVSVVWLLASTFVHDKRWYEGSDGVTCNHDGNSFRFLCRNLLEDPLISLASHYLVFRQ